MILEFAHLFFFKYIGVIPKKYSWNDAVNWQIHGTPIGWHSQCDRDWRENKGPIGPIGFF